jgi:hypothetical protein
MAFTQYEKFVSRSRIWIICAAFLLCALAVAAVGFVRGRTNNRPVSALDYPIVIIPAALQQETADDDIEAEIVTIRPIGFEPSAITRPRGEFLLVINNRSGLKEINWRLAREAGGNLREVRIYDGKSRSGNFEDLPPGRYVLTEANHPDWICRLTITSR